MRSTAGSDMLCNGPDNDCRLHCAHTSAADNEIASKNILHDCDTSLSVTMLSVHSRQILQPITHVHMDRLDLRVRCQALFSKLSSNSAHFDACTER